MKSVLVIGVLVGLFASCTEEAETANPSDPDGIPSVNALVVNDTTLEFEGQAFMTSINWPLISSPVDDKDLDSAIYYTFSMEQVLGYSIGELEEEYNSGMLNLSHVSYKVNYNKNGVFDISFFIESVSAHLIHSTVHYAMDLHGYTQITMEDLFSEHEEEAFLFKCNEILHERIKASYESVARKSSEVKEFFNGHRFTKSDLNNFVIREGGLTVHYEFSFPHYARAFEPDGAISFTWEELIPYLNQESELVQRLVSGKIS